MKKILIYCFLLISVLLSCSSAQDSNNSESAINKSEINDSISENASSKEKERDKNLEIISEIKAGQSLIAILSKYGVPKAISLQTQEQKEIDFNFKDLQAGKKYKIILDKDSVLLSFHYQATATKVYSILFTKPLKYTASATTLKETIVEATKETKLIDKNAKETEIKNFLMGKFELKEHSNFVLVAKKYHNKSEMYLQKETLESFIKMREAAEKVGITLTIISGTRNFNSQKSIWEKKYKANKEAGLSDIENIKKIMLWSSMPSTSRHHWGTDIDINGFEEYFDGKNEKSNKEYEWLVNNAHKFGFCQVYTKKAEGKRTTGYNEEKWHWSYMPLSSIYLKQYKELITYSDINGFSASEFTKELNILKEFVFGIGNDCN